MFHKLQLRTLEKIIRKRINEIGFKCPGKTILFRIAIFSVGLVFSIYMLMALIDEFNLNGLNKETENIKGGHGNNKNNSFACKAAEIRGKYKTIACQDEQLDQIHSKLNSSDEDKRLSRDRSTILEYSSNGKGTYTVRITSDSLSIPKIKFFRLDVPMQRISGDQRFPAKSSYVITYKCVGDDLVKTKEYPNGKVLTQQRTLTDDNANIVEVVYKEDGVTAKRVLQKIE